MQENLQDRLVTRHYAFFSLLKVKKESTIYPLLHTWVVATIRKIWNVNLTRYSKLLLIPAHWYDIPACIFFVGPQIHNKAATSVESHPTPDRVCPQSGLGLVPPWHEETLWQVYIIWSVPTWTIRTHVFHFPRVWSMAVLNGATHEAGGPAGVLVHSNLPESSIAYKLRVSICDEAWQ